MPWPNIFVNQIHNFRNNQSIWTIFFFILRGQDRTYLISLTHSDILMKSKDLSARVYALPPNPIKIDAEYPMILKTHVQIYMTRVQDVQDPNEENTEDPFTYLQDSNMNFRAVNLAYDDTSSHSNRDGTIPKDYFKPSVY
ncbi:hypothetical protein AAHE18_19G250400 [Arachis hypogaea]